MITPIYLHWACRLPPMLHPTCCACIAQWLIPGISMLHAPLTPTAQSTAPHTMQTLYNNEAIHIAPTITYIMHCFATDQLLSMQCTTAPSPVLVAGVKPALAAWLASGSAPLHHTNIHAAEWDGYWHICTYIWCIYIHICIYTLLGYTQLVRDLAQKLGWVNIWEPSLSNKS